MYDDSLRLSWRDKLLALAIRIHPNPRSVLCWGEGLERLHASVAKTLLTKRLFADPLLEDMPPTESYASFDVFLLHVKGDHSRTGNLLTRRIVARVLQQAPCGAVIAISFETAGACSSCRIGKGYVEFFEADERDPFKIVAWVQGTARSFPDLLKQISSETEHEHLLRSWLGSSRRRPIRLLEASLRILYRDLRTVACTFRCGDEHISRLVKRGHVQLSSIRDGVLSDQPSVFSLQRVKKDLDLAEKKLEDGEIAAGRELEPHVRIYRAQTDKSLVGNRVRLYYDLRYPDAVPRFALKILNSDDLKRIMKTYCGANRFFVNFYAEKATQDPPSNDSRWHIDTLARRLKVWFLIEDVGRDNAPLLLLEGSHLGHYHYWSARGMARKALLQSGRYVGFTWHELAPRRGEQPSCLLGSRGDCHVFDAAAFHSVTPCGREPRYTAMFSFLPDHSNERWLEKFQNDISPWAVLDLDRPFACEEVSV